MVYLFAYGPAHSLAVIKVGYGQVAALGVTEDSG